MSRNVVDRRKLVVWLVNLLDSSTSFIFENALEVAAEHYLAVEFDENVANRRASVGVVRELDHLPHFLDNMLSLFAAAAAALQPSVSLVAPEASAPLSVPVSGITRRDLSGHGEHPHFDMYNG